MVRVARAAHELARNTGIGLRDPDAELLLHVGHSLLDGAADQFDVVDASGVDPFDRLHGERRHVEEPPGIANAGGHCDFRRTEVDRYGITSLFHLFSITFIIGN